METVGGRDFKNREKDPKVEQLKTPPHSIEAEQSVLGSMLIAPDSWDKVAEVVIKEDFYNRSHQIIFAAIIRLLEKSEPVDLVTVSENLEEKQELEDAGGFAYLAELAKNTPSAANVVAYANIIKERAIRRELIGAANDIAETSFFPEGLDSTEILDKAENKVFQIAEKRTSQSEGPQDINTVLKATIDRLDALNKQGSEITGVSTGFTDLDKMTSGLQRSDLIIVAARPSMGKCIVSGSELVNPDTGAIETIDDIVKSGCGNVLAVNGSFRFEKKTIARFVDDGIKPVFSVRTALGREIQTTLTHPFLTGDGWRKLQDISVGELIGVPRELPVFGQEHMAEHEVKTLAYFVADGGTTSTSPLFTNTNSEIVADFIDSVSHFTGALVNRVAYDFRAPSYRVSGNSEFCATFREQFALILRQTMRALGLTGKALASQLTMQCSTVSQWRNATCLPNPSAYRELCVALGHDFASQTRDSFAQGSNSHNPVTAFLRDHKVWQKLAHEKHIPDAIFTLPKPLLATFLNRLFACDGGVSISKAQQVRVCYGSASKKLAQQVQHLLLRFGIIAKLRAKTHHQRTQYEVEVLHQDSLRVFFRDIGIIGKQKRIDESLQLLQDKLPRVNKDKLPESVVDYILLCKGNRSWRELFIARGWQCPEGFHPHLVGTSKRQLNRSRVGLFAELLDDEYLRSLASSQLYWDEIIAIDFKGYQQVYDLTVPDLHNFIAQDICVHNTTFAMNLCENAMMMQDKPVLVYSLEMPSEQIMMRSMASLSRVDQTRVRTAQLEDEDWARISNTVKQLDEKNNLYIDDSSGLTPMEVRSRARKIHRDHGGLSLIMVDYLQLMRAPAFSDNRTLEIAEISRSLKALAKELEVPVVALSQLNRSLEQRADKRPINSDLRESGSIEQDADLIMFVYRDEVYNENSPDKGVAEIIIGKQRNGPIGTCRLTFQGKYSRFDNYTPIVNTDYPGE